MKKLLIVESPSKIKTIAKFLDKSFKIMSTLGHVKDLPENELGVHMNGTITIDYVVLNKKDKLIADICKEASTAHDIFLAPDPDREGEIIAWHIAQEIAKVVKDPKKIHRITFNEITQSAVEDALAHPRSIDAEKVAAQQARRVLDRWVGYEVSPILWRKISKGLSAGRVQSVALKLICDREESIRIFKPEEYWTIHAQFITESGTSFQAELTHVRKKKVEIPHHEAAEKLVVDSKKNSYHIESIKDTKRAKNPNPPFMTSTLQQAAYNRLGFSVQKTMQIAQKLYEGIPLEDSQSVALITYMRTDSVRIAESAIKTVRSLIAKIYGAQYVPSQQQNYTKKKAQDAHEAIRPIDIALSPEKIIPFVDADTAKLYTLIWQRFVACQMKPAQYAQRSITIQGGNYTFKATGSTLLFDGFMRVYTISDEEEEDEGKSSLPQHLEANMALSIQVVTPKQHFTQPPPRYTEASLVKDLEKEGIGRPSTYATIMKTIQARAYTELDAKKRFIPTELGMAVIKMLTEHLPKIMNVQFTATMEEDLDKIAQGEMERDALLREFYANFQQDLEAFRGDKVKREAEQTDITCPLCTQGVLVIRFGKAGPFLGCSRFPECSFTSNFKRNEDGTITLTAAPEPKMLAEKCPQCGKQLRELQGKFGKFIACSGYPDCTYIHQTKAKFPCPLCGGEIIKRSWKGKIFWGCSEYPQCKFSISGDIEETPCPQCGTPYLLKRVTQQGTVLLSCSKKDCGYKKESQE